MPSFAILAPSYPQLEKASDNRRGVNINLHACRL